MVVHNAVEAFKQSVLSLAFNLGGILAGSFLALYFDVFSLAPWTFVVYPGILTMRGVIGGLFCGRLGTGLHLGTVRASLLKNTKYFYTLWYAIVTLTLKSSIMMWLAASLFSVFLWGIDLSTSLAIFGVITATMVVSLPLISPLTLLVSFLSFKKGLDPDIIAYPVISTIADVLVTLCYIFVLDLFFLFSPLGGYLIGSIGIIFTGFVLFILSKNFREYEYAKTIKESFLTLITVSIIVNITGSLLSEINQLVGRRPEVYTVYPALIDTVGDVGSIVGSTTTTKLALGTIGSSFTSIKNHFNEIGATWIASLVMFTLYSVIAMFPWYIRPHGKFMMFTFMLYTTNVMAVLPMVILAYLAAILTYRRGWDPDNFVIPIESTIADAITTLSLFIATSIIL